MKIVSPKTINSIVNHAVQVAENMTCAKPLQHTQEELSRFSSPQMQMARIMNKIALRNTRLPKKFTFPKATVKDLERLTSNTLEASYERVTWINPHDNKIYHILKETELKDGKIGIRILDEDGAFLKNAEITPKKIIVIDDFSSNKTVYGLTHGEIVTTFLKRNNPFAQIETINVGSAGSFNEEFFIPFKQILQRIKNGEKIDYISCSRGGNCYSTSQNMRGVIPEYQTLTDIADSGTRVLFASGNSFDNPKGCANQVLLLADKVEGVGSISPKTHRLSDFSAARNSFFTQHYEVGEHYIRPTEYGANITGISGTDIVIDNPRYNEEIKNNILIGKAQERVDRLINSIKSEIENLRKEKAKLFIGKIDFDKLRAIEERQTILEQRRIKLIKLKGATKLEDGKYEAAETFFGTSFSTPIRTAKLALNDMLENIL